MGDEIRSVQPVGRRGVPRHLVSFALGFASLSARDTLLKSFFMADQPRVALRRAGIQVAVVPEAPGQSRVEVRGVVG